MSSSQTASPRARRLRRSKACIQCTQAKKRCDKQPPMCWRCVEKGITCTFPPNRRGNQNNDEAARPASLELISQHDRCNQELGRSLLQQFLPQNYLYGLLANRPAIIAHGLEKPWFLASESWELAHNNLYSQPYSAEYVFGDSTLHCFIELLQSWLRQWVNDGHHPLFHRQLFESDLLSNSKPFEDAYLTVAAYMSKTPATKPMVMRIITNRAKELVRTQPDPHELDDAAAGDSMATTVLLDTVSHLTRTQALFIYQLLALFDGDIRARALAEHHIDTLRRWSAQMWESAQLDVDMLESQAAAGMAGNPGMTRSASATSPSLAAAAAAAAATGPGANAFALDGSLASLWRAWVLSESVRRVYLAANILLCVYHTLRDGTAGCPGGVTFSAQRGLWEARSPPAWLAAAKAARGGAGLIAVPSLGVDALFEEAAPESVDDFAQSMMLIEFGRERTELWAAGGGASAGSQVLV